MNLTKILAISFIISFAILILVTVQVYGFTMTPQLVKQETLVQICIFYNISSTSCDQVYGGIPNESKPVQGNETACYIIDAYNRYYDNQGNCYFKK